MSARFPIGFWNYAPLAAFTPACVADWAEAGMTIACSPRFEAGKDSPAAMRAILDEAGKAQIGVILDDSRTHWPALRGGEEAYRRGFLAAAGEFGGHPAVLGFQVGDEPDAENFPLACRALRIQKELAPRLSPFCNLLPWHWGCEERVGYRSWPAYLDAYVREGRPDFLCYDCYSQQNPGQEGWEMYFRNLREYQEAGQRNGLPFWTTLLSVGHFRYRCPSEDDLRWQLNTAVAHGAKGILWFFFYMRVPHDNYRVAPIDEHWERTETYERLSRVNRTFLKSQAARLGELELQRVSHAGQAFGGVPAFASGALVTRAKSNHKTPLIVSEFKDRQGREHVALVNNSQTESTQAELWVGGRRPLLHRVGWEGRETPVLRGDGWTASRGEDFVAVRPWLAPGQLELYRVEHEAGNGRP